LTAKLVLAPLGMPNVFDPQLVTDIECSSFKPPHDYLQACTENFPNMDGVVCKTSNSRPEVMLSYRITLMSSYNFTMLQCVTKPYQSSMIVLICRGCSFGDSNAQGRCLQLRYIGTGDDHRASPLQSGIRSNLATMGPLNNLKLQDIAECARPHPHERCSGSPTENGDGAGSGAPVHTRQSSRTASNGGRSQNVGPHQNKAG
jgi:hypothetical protein